MNLPINIAESGPPSAPPRQPGGPFPFFRWDGPPSVAVACRLADTGAQCDLAGEGIRATDLYGSGIPRHLCPLPSRYSPQESCAPCPFSLFPDPTPVTAITAALPPPCYFGLAPGEIREFAFRKANWFFPDPLPPSCDGVSGDLVSSNRIYSLWQLRFNRSSTPILECRILRFSGEHRITVFQKSASFLTAPVAR
jgi:hypothetical protein